MEAYNIIRLVIVIISGLSIFLGYRLFYLVSERQGKLKIEGSDASLAISDVGPGVFFALFGAVVLVAILWTQPYSEITKTEKGGGTTVSERNPASETDEPSGGIEFDTLCVSEGQEDIFREGISSYEATLWFYKNEPYKEIKETEENSVFLVLKELEYPASEEQLEKMVSTYSDYYIALKSALYFFYLSYKC